MPSPMLQFFMFWIMPALLALALFFPVTRLIWVMRVRREERRLGESTSDEERRRQLKIARFIAVVIVVVFAFLFNRTLMVPPS